MKKYILFYLVTPLALSLTGCATIDEASAPLTMPITEELFGITSSGEAITEYTLTNATGMEVAIINYGGIVTKLKVPDRNGHCDDIVLGFKTLPEYEADNSYQGALIGRYANRIAKGRFEIDGCVYELATNSRSVTPQAHLHGGTTGYNKAIWDAEPMYKKGASGVKLTYLSKDGEEGYPGNLDVTVHYWLTDDNEFVITYHATTDKKTYLNLTNHNYYNLRGEGNGTVLDHKLMINADDFTPFDKGLIPTGEIKPVRGTPFDFREPCAIRERINQNAPQLEYANGYAHNWVLNKQGDDLAPAATLYEPESGRLMQIYTDQPGILLYTGNSMDGSLIGKSGQPYVQYGALCLETQHYPDSPNQPSFPSTLLEPGETFRSTTVYKFSAK